MVLKVFFHGFEVFFNGFEEFFMVLKGSFILGGLSKRLLGTMLFKHF